MLGGARRRTRDAFAAWLDRTGDPARIGRAVSRAQTTRVRLSEVEEALLHFWLLPAREDLRSLRRRVRRLRREEIGRAHV